MFLLSILLLALATPAPHAASAAPATSAPNPFNLDPVPATPLPRKIGGTKSRAICTAIRSAVAPAVSAAISTDRQFTSLRKDVYDYTVSYRDGAGADLKIVQMDAKVQSMVKSTDLLERILKSDAFVLPRTASPDDQQQLAKIRSAMAGVLVAQKVELDAMSGFVETERMRRFGDLTEDEKLMSKAVGEPNTRDTVRDPQTGQVVEAGSRAFLRDSNTTFKQPHSKISLTDARNLDRDLGDIADFAGHKGDQASRVIVPATELCK